MSGDPKPGREIESLKGKNACGNDREDRDLGFIKIFPRPVYRKNDKNKGNYPEYDADRDAKSAIAEQKIRNMRGLSPVYYNNTYYVISVTGNTC